EFVLVEGVGGWAAPITVALDQADLVRALDVPVILVVGLRLGCINHSRLSAQAIHSDGLRLLGWIGNTIDPEFERCAETVAILDRCIPAPRLGLLPHAPDMAAAGGAAALSAAAAVLAHFRQGAAHVA
ncbi:MAG: ATP-dependent dethiobiotin synthetase BioD, partial [Lysobacteraceae bacterium]